MKSLDARSFFARLKRSRWTKVVLLTALPVGLYLAARERASWRPRTLLGSRGASEIVFSPDGKRIAASVFNAGPRKSNGTLQWWDGETTLWDINKPSLLGRNATRWQLALGLHFSPDGTLLAGISRKRYSSHTQVSVWDGQTGQLHRTLALSNASERPQHIFWNGRNKLTIVGISSMRQWNVSTGKLLNTSPVSDDVASAKALSPDGLMMVGISSPTEIG